MLMLILGLRALSKHLDASLVIIPEKRGKLRSNTSYLPHKVCNCSVKR